MSKKRKRFIKRKKKKNQNFFAQLGSIVQMVYYIILCSAVILYTSGKSTIYCKNILNQQRFSKKIVYYIVCMGQQGINTSPIMDKPYKNDLGHII